MTIDYHAVAATITAGLIQHKPAEVEVTPADAAKLYWQVREALIAAAPKAKASASGLHM